MSGGGGGGGGGESRWAKDTFFFLAFNFTID